MYIPKSSGAWTTITNGFRLTDSASQDIADLIHTSAVTTLKGADATQDDLNLQANVTDTYPVINMQGNSYIDYKAGANADHRFYHGATIFAGISGLLSRYSIYLYETGTAPGNKGNYGQFYAKNDDTLHYIDGGGVDHTIQFVWGLKMEIDIKLIIKDENIQELKAGLGKALNKDTTEINTEWFKDFLQDMIMKYYITGQMAIARETTTPIIKDDIIEVQ